MLKKRKEKRNSIREGRERERGKDGTSLVGVKWGVAVVVFVMSRKDGLW